MTMDSADRLDLSISILTFNRRDCLRDLLSELRPLLAHVREIVVVDNCSDDGTDEMVRNEFPDFVHLRTTENRGVAARNLGMRRASSSVVVTIDDDILGLTAGACAWIHEQFVANPSLGALNLQVNDWFTGRVCNWVHHRSVTDAVARFETYEITEGAVAFRRDMVVEAGGYFEEFFIAHEGPDLAYRLMNRGWEVLYDGHVTVLHKHEQQSRKPWRFYYYDTRNQVWLAARNMPAWAATRYLSRGLTAMAVYSIRDGFFQWWIKGVVDGIRGLPSIWRTRQVWTAHTRNLCAGIDSKRPPFWYLVRHRLFHRGNKLEA